MKNMIRVENAKLELIDGIVEGMVVTENKIYSFDVAEWDAEGNEPTKYEITVFENKNDTMGDEIDIIIAEAEDVLEMFGFKSDKINNTKEKEKTNMKHFTITYKNGEIIEQDTLTSVKQLIQLEGFKIDKVVNNLTNEVIHDNTNLVDALIKCDLVEDVESIEIDSNTIITDLGEYIVFNNYTDAEAEAVAQCKQIMEVCGLSDSLIFEAELKGWIDADYFKEYWEELHYSMSYDEGIYNIMDSDEVELYESGELSEEDIRDNYYNALQDSIQNNWIDEFKYQFGDELFNEIVIKENLIDIEALAQWCVDMDGVAHYLASYDGEELEENGYYIYRTN